MTSCAIEFRGVRKRFKNNKVEILSGVDASIEEGSFVTILGGSGSGKTTLLKMVNKIFEPSEGEILFFGENINDIDTVKHKRNIGYVIQQIGLFPHMTVYDNIATVPKILKWDKKKIDERIDFLLDLVNLEPEKFKKRFPSQLSGGQQQRVGLARAMAADPSVMLMDEPFGAIDAITREKLQGEIIHIQKKLCKTILFVTHDINEAFKLGDKVLIINEGRVEQFDTPSNILFNPKNDYIKKLISKEEMFQKLKVLKAEDIMKPSTERLDNKNTVDREEDLYDILGMFMNTDIEYVHVIDKEKNILGEITWNELRIRK